MSWRIVSVSSLAKLDYKMDYLVVRTQDSVRRVHLSEISVLLIESAAASSTAYLLCELAKRKNLNCSARRRSTESSASCFLRPPNRPEPSAKP